MKKSNTKSHTPGAPSANRFGAKRLLSLLVILLVNVGIIAYMAIKEFAQGEIHAQKVPLLSIKPLYLLMACCCFLVAILMEMFKYESMLRVAEGSTDRRGAFECAVLGKYYDNITPLGAGGQPFQIRYLSKRGYSNGTSAALPVAGFLSLQLAFCLIAIVVFVFNGSVTDSLPVIRYSAYVGLLFYLFFPMCIVLFAIFPKAFSRVVRFFIRVLHKLRIIKHLEKTTDKVIGMLDDYRSNLLYLSKIPHLFIKIFIFSLIYQVAILSIPFFTLRAFGGTSDWWHVFSLVLYIYTAIAFIPTPGNAGAAEGSFYAVFSSLSGGFLFWAILSWRILVYYIWLVLGMCLYGFNTLRSRQPKKPLPEPAEHPSSVQFVDEFYPLIDGVTRTVDSYAKRMNKTSRSCVVCCRSATPYTDSADYEVLRVPALRLLSCLLPLPGYAKQLKSYLKEHKFEIIHTHSPFFMGSLALSMGKRLGIPVVATFHSKYCEDIYDLTHSKFLARLLTNSVLKFYCRVDAVWACSATTAQALRDYGFRGRITIMENGVEPIKLDDPQALKTRTLEQLKLPQNKRLLLFVGSQLWRKNLLLVLNTAKELKKRGEDFYTVIAGSGRQEAAIRGYAGQEQLGESVRFIGQVDAETLHGLYLACDLFFFPSVHDHAPLVLREAAVLGLPALLVRGSPASEPVTDGVNGYIGDNDPVLMADRIERIFAEGSLQEVGQNALNTLPVDWDEIVTRVEQEYRQQLLHSGMPMHGE